MISIMRIQEGFSRSVSISIEGRLLVPPVLDWHHAIKFSTWPPSLGRFVFPLSRGTGLGNAATRDDSVQTVQEGQVWERIVCRLHQWVKDMTLCL